MGQVIATVQHIQNRLERPGRQTQAMLAGVLRRAAANWSKKRSWCRAVEPHSLTCCWTLHRQVHCNWDIGSSFLFQSADTEGQEAQAEMALFGRTVSDTGCITVWSCVSGAPPALPAY